MLKIILIRMFPLENVKWENISKISIENNELKLFAGDNTVNILNIEQYIGYRILDERKFEVILIKNNLHIRILIDPDNNIGKTDIANIADIYFEAAISTIMDCEDSVATVDGEDKVAAYKNWLGLMKGNLTAKFNKGSISIERKLSEDLPFTTKNGENLL